MTIRAIPALVGLGVSRVLGRLTGPTPGRTVVCCFGVAAAIAVLVIVTGVSLGLAGSGTVASEDVDYWIVPDDGGAGSTPLAYEASRLGAVHPTTARIAADDRVDYATPVAIRPVRLEPHGTDADVYVLLLGIVAPPDGREVAGLETGALSPGDPHYANGSFDGPWTDDLVVSEGVTDQLGVGPGADVTAGDSDRNFTVRAVAEGEVSLGAGTVPVGLVHLSELQAVTDTSGSDQADQILVSPGDASVRGQLEGLYPRTSVVTRSGFSRLSAESSSLPFAMALAAGLVSLGIGVAFVATMMGLELTATRQSLAVLGAVGFSGRSVALVLVVETVTVALLGGVVGVALGWLGIVGLNAGVAAWLDLPSAATFDPVLAGYGLVAAVVVALLSVGYPLYIAWRTELLPELTR